MMMRRKTNPIALYNILHHRGLLLDERAGWPNLCRDATDPSICKQAAPGHLLSGFTFALGFTIVHICVDISIKTKSFTQSLPDKLSGSTIQ
ncbi:hypothetical protein [Mucilaginibacter sp. UR6-11]|uniref:hypothetical protein n=1 Tax=Mucilaginibacter sp. UR6-11 TaxID=1435644 RepID=UPI001E59DBAC|nr:hypothetical protein [Mucilaginibacter sp. UR6-11]MCC8425062.1 hypothetical protein [Mucilaginibacter sp. UR6-11]